MAKSSKPVAIVQGEVGIVDASYERCEVGTVSASVCVIVAMYNPTKKIAALSHIDASQDVSQTINLMKYQLAGESDQKLFVYLSTGEKTHNTTLDNIQNKISSNNNIELKELFESESMIIDASTGEVEINIAINRLDQMGNYKNRLETRFTEALFSFGQKLHCKVFFDNRKPIPEGLSSTISSEQKSEANNKTPSVDQLNTILGKEVVEEIRKGVFSSEAFEIVCNNQTKANTLKNLLKDIIFLNETVNLEESKSSHDFINDKVIIPKSHEEFFVDYCNEHC